MKVAIMRHGPAEDGAWGGYDADRALTPDGRARVRKAAELLNANDEAPLFVVSSPLVRALQTAELIAAGCRVEERGGQVLVRRSLAPGADMLEVLHELRADRRKRIMLVGHEPSVGAAVSELLGQFLPRGFSKAMVVSVSVADAPGGWDANFRFLADAKTGRFERVADAVFESGR